MNPEKVIRDQAKHDLKNSNLITSVSCFLTVIGVVYALVYFSEFLQLLLSFAVSKSYSFLSVFFSDEFLYALCYGNLLIFFTVPIELLFVSPIFTGFFRFFYLQSKYGTASFKELFYYFHGSYSKALELNFLLLLRCLWRIAVCVTPVAVVFAVASNSTDLSYPLAISGEIWYLIGYVLSFAALLIFSRLSLKFFLCIYIFIEDESIEVNTLFSEAQRMIEPLKMRVMKLILSLSPWLLLCFAIIPSLFVVPYVFECLSTSAKWIISLQTKNRDE